MTFSIVARDPATGDLGIAIASKALAVGAVAPFARAGVGAISTQALPNVTYGPDALEQLAAGEDAETVLAALTAADSMASQRQAGIVDALGRSASWTGSNCMAWAGGPNGPRGRDPGEHPDRPRGGGRDAGRLGGRLRDVPAAARRGAAGRRPGRRRQPGTPVRGAARAGARRAASAGPTTAGSISGSTTTRIPSRSWAGCWRSTRSRPTCSIPTSSPRSDPRSSARPGSRSRARWPPRATMHPRPAR